MGVSFFTLGCTNTLDPDPRTDLDLGRFAARATDQQAGIAVLRAQLTNWEVIWAD